MSLLGLDVGGSGCKAVAFTEDGRPLARAYRSYGQLQPRRDWLEFDLEDQWLKLRDAIREVATAPALRRDPLRGLAFSVAGDAVVSVDRDGQQIYPSIASSDLRGWSEAEWLSTKLGGAARLYALTGLPLDSMYALNRIVWFREHMPEVFSRARKWLCWHDFFVSKLGLPPTIDWSLAGRTLAFDVRQRRWSQEILDAAHVDIGLLATPAPAGTRIGELPSRVATDLALPSKVQVAVGGFDQAMAALGAGAARPGVGAIGTGSVEAAIVPLLEPVLIAPADELVRAGISVTPQAGSLGYLAIGFHFTAGTLMRWYRDTLGAAEVQAAAERGVDAFELLDARMPSDPTELLVIPHFAGAFSPARDPAARGGVFGLTLHTARLELARALLEGTAFELRRILEFLAAAGAAPQRFRAVGGGARSDVWLQIKADVLGRPIERPREVEAGCLAAAMLAGVATGVYVDSGQAVATMVWPGTTFEPDAARTSFYNDRYAVYCDLATALSPLGGRLAATRIQSTELERTKG